MMNNMTPEQLEEQTRQAIKDWCDNPSSQLECCFKGGNFWSPRRNRWLNTGSYYYRIMTVSLKFYRVALIMNGPDCYTKTVDNEVDEKIMEDRAGFVEWLSERVYYKETNTTFRERVIKDLIRNKVIVEEGNTP